MKIAPVPEIIKTKDGYFYRHYSSLLPIESLTVYELSQEQIKSLYDQGYKELFLKNKDFQIRLMAKKIIEE